MKNVVVKVTSKEHGAEVIRAFKDLGVDAEMFKGVLVGFYYGLFNGWFDALQRPHDSQVITLEELKAMSNHEKQNKMKNVVVKVTSEEHGAEVIQAFKDLGVDTETFKGTETGWYYGLFDGEFNLMESPYNSQVITLEELKAMANPYPKVMWVWEHEGAKPKKRVVFMEKNGRYLSWVNSETLEDSKKNVGVSVWQNAKDIEKPTEITLEQIAEKFGVDVEQIKIKK